MRKWYEEREHMRMVLLKSIDSQLTDLLLSALTNTSETDAG